MIYKSVLLFTIFGLILLWTPLVFGAIGGETSNVEEVTEDEQAQEAYENDQSFTAKKEVTVNGHTFPPGTEFNSGSGFDVPDGKYVTGPDGGMYTGSGIQMENGQLKNAEQIGLETSEGSAEGRNAQNMNFNPPRYTIGSADYWQTSDFTVFNGQGIQKSSNAFTVKKAEKIELNNMTLTDAELLYATEDELSIVSADKVEGNGLKADNIINSTYSIRP